MSTNTLTIGVGDRALRLPGGATQPPIELPDRAATGPFVGLVQKLAALRQKQPDGYVATFTSVSPGEGVTYVVESLAWELARHTGQSVLVAAPSAIEGLARAPFRITRTDSHRVWRLGERATEAPPAETSDCWDALQRVRERFGFVLLDCPALSQSSAIFRSAAVSDGLVLVVAAGETRRRDAEEAKSVLAATATPIIGLVLNKHESPVPGFLSSLL